LRITNQICQEDHCLCKWSNPCLRSWSLCRRIPARGLDLRLLRRGERLGRSVI
jgi:hypothetical protein